MRQALAVFGLAISCAAFAQPTDVSWPREVKAADGTVITVYQPQLERWADNRLSGRAAVSVKPQGGAEPHYGVIELGARTQVDKSADLVTLSEVSIAKGSFPGQSQADADKYLAALRGALAKNDWPVSAQALQANLAVAQAQSKQKAVPVKNDPPQILFRTSPSLLLLVDGEPALRDAKDAAGLKRVANTSALMLLEEASATYYLWALERWWQSKTLGGEWQVASAPPASLEQARAAAGKEFNQLDGKDADGKPVFAPGAAPQILVATRPTELLQSQGEPKLTPIPGTQLLYVANSRNDILMALGGQAYYALISGRWFTAKALSGPWSFASAKSLPADFARIPAGHPMGDVRMSVAGTPEAREAAIANTIPQTATVQRDVAPTPVDYDGGPPQWKPVEGTPLSYAFNSRTAVIQVDPKSYLMVQNGVWFSATSPYGSWKVAVTVPAVIYTIPASSPMHYVTYVRVYGSTPTVVYVGYTPGYYGTVLSSDGVVVYGTGYVYPYYMGPYYYYPPPYYTYGYGAGFTVGFFFGFAMGGGWHGPCCYGGGGVYISHHNNINVNNSYNRWGGKSTSISGPGGRDVKASQVGNTTFAKGSGSNNVYAGRDGNVYKRGEGGDWQKYGGKGEGWSDVDKPARPDNKLPGETRQSLDRQAQSRDLGAQRAQDFRSSGGYQGGGGFHGGGGMRGGGGRGGGRR
jgi:hypothetical protein